MNTFLSEHISGMKLIQIFARKEVKYNEFADKSMDLFKANWREVMTFAIKGRIAESGNHQELLAQGGLYKKLYELQLMGN